MAGPQFYGGPDLQRAGFWRARGRIEAPHKFEGLPRRLGFKRLNTNVNDEHQLKHWIKYMCVYIYIYIYIYSLERQRLPI